MRYAEAFEVLSTQRDHRIIRRKCRGRDRHGSAVERLCIGRPICLLSEDSEVVQDVGEIPVEWAQLVFLTAGGVPEQFFR
jgi:hypothetical protein